MIVSMKVIRVKQNEVLFLKSLNNTILSDYLQRGHIESKTLCLILSLQTTD